MMTLEEREREGEGKGREWEERMTMGERENKEMKGR